MSQWHFRRIRRPPRGIFLKRKMKDQIFRISEFFMESTRTQSMIRFTPYLQSCRFMLVSQSPTLSAHRDRDNSTWSFQNFNSAACLTPRRPQKTLQRVRKFRMPVDVRTWSWWWRCILYTSRIILFPQVAILPSPLSFPAASKFKLFSS